MTDQRHPADPPRGEPTSDGDPPPAPATPEAEVPPPAVGPAPLPHAPLGPPPPRLLADRYLAALTPGPPTARLGERRLVDRIRRAMRGGPGVPPQRYGVAIEIRRQPADLGLGLYAVTVRHADGRRAADRVERCAVSTRLLTVLDEAQPRLMGTPTLALLRPVDPLPADPDRPLSALLLTLAIPCPTPAAGSDPGALVIVHSMYPTPQAVLGWDWTWDAEDPGEPPLILTTTQVPRGLP